MQTRTRPLTSFVLACLLGLLVFGAAYLFTTFSETFVVLEAGDLRLFLPMVAVNVLALRFGGGASGASTATSWAIVVVGVIVLTAPTFVLTASRVWVAHVRRVKEREQQRKRDMILPLNEDSSEAECRELLDLYTNRNAADLDRWISEGGALGPWD